MSSLTVRNCLLNTLDPTSLGNLFQTVAPASEKARGHHLTMTALTSLTHFVICGTI